MASDQVLYPDCPNQDAVNHGFTTEGKQRYQCRTAECYRTTFSREYSYRGYLPEVKQSIADIVVNGSGVRDTARVLHISLTTMIEAFKEKLRIWESVNRNLLAGTPPLESPVRVVQVAAAACDERWSFVASKGNQRWLWHAIDHGSGKCWPTY